MGSLVGRARELALLRDAVARAAAGNPSAVLVTGEAGVGKSRLLRALTDDPPHLDALVLRAQCVDLGDPGLPHLSTVDLVRDLRTVAATDPEVAAVLERHPLVAGLADPDAPTEPYPDESRALQLLDATATVLGSVGRSRGPVVVVVEDLQWVDSSSADFLRFLLSRMSSERLTVLATVRTDGLAVRPRARRLLGELARFPAVQRLDLGPLDESEVEALLTELDSTPSNPADVHEVFRLSRGNPYYVETLAAGMTSSGGLDTALPRALADLLVGRLDGLSDDARAMVRSAAVAGHRVADRVLRATSGLSEGGADQALRLAVGEGILVPDGDGYAIPHDLLRAAVQDDLLPGERARLHAAHAAALEAGTSGRPAPAEVAHHYTEAQNAPKILEWSVRAATDAMRLHAPAEALEHLERALATWPHVADAAALAGESNGRVAVRAAHAAGLAGEPARGVELARQAIRLCDTDGDASGGVRARSELVRRLIAANTTDQGVPPATEAVALAESATVDPTDAALAHVVLARALVSERRTDEARSQVGRALEAARAAGAAGLEVEALAAAAFVDEIDGDRPAAARRLGAALRLARDAGELAAELRAHYSLASLHYYNGDVEGSLPVLRAAMTRVTETGLRWSEPGVEVRILLAVACYVSGDLGGSLEAAETPESRPPDVAAARLAAVSCYPAVARGLPDVDGRFAALRDSWDLEPQIGLVAGGCEADRLSWDGQHAAAAAMAERAQGHLDRLAGGGMYGGLWLSAIALAALADAAADCRRRRDRPGSADAEHRGEALLERVERIVAGGYGRPGELGPEGRAWHARSLAEHARLGGDPAVERWQAALDAFGYGHAYEQARCHWRLADAWVAAGDRAAARPHAEAAAESARVMRAAPLQRAVAATMSRAGLAGPGAAGATVLTAREQEVLALVAEGLTNREVGRRLFISEKTASVHLSNLMAKLGVSSRTEAVTVAHRRGLLDVL
ncbi:helix-turn-helix transcriptional regulator [Nocardioides dilutus]